MLDLLSPVRGYIAQSLQFYLSKYIEDIQLEGLGLFGGDLVLNDLEIKRHVLRESLDIPSSFDFSRGFIRELRIHIPWTQLLSQPIEVKLYTIELILTAKKQADAAPKTPAASTPAPDAPEEDKIEQPKSGWIHDTLQKILANVSVQVNNLVLKYEHDDVVFSIALGTLDFYSASESGGWKRSFEDLRGGRRAVCKRIDAKDVTIFLDRYTSNGASKDGQTQDQVRRKVVGYEVPVLSRTSASVRAKLQLFPNAAVREDQDGLKSRPSSPLHQKLSTAKDGHDEESIIDVDGLFAYRPSVMCDPFYSYSCNRSSANPMYEVDVFIGELLFSVSDRQLEMLNQLITSASRKIDQAHGHGIRRTNVPSSVERNVQAQPSHVQGIPAITGPPNDRVEGQQPDNSAKKQESWLGWAMNALGTTEDEGEDELVSELLAETRGALLKAKPPVSDVNEDPLTADGPVTKTSCVRVCISSASLTLRKHEKEKQAMEHQDSIIGESGEELVPVANLGMVKVSLQTRKRKVARPAVPILHLSLSYIALEMLLARGEEQSGTDLVFEIEKVELVSATASENREDSKCKKGQVLLTWGSIDSSHFSDCVSHPYFINSFFGEETTRLNQRETRSFEIVKVSLDADIPVWKTLEVGRSRRGSDGNVDSPCNCSTTWNDEAVRCVSIATLSDICQEAIRAIGIKERVLDGGILSNAVSTAWASGGFPISISESMARTFTSVAEEYRALRNPDVGAHDNLAQLLQPQLVALFSRYSLHSCSEASLHGSSQPSNIRHRSVHSALRLRFASTSNVSAGDGLSPGDYSAEETISKVLDVSIGAAQAVLDPEKCVEIMKTVMVVLRSSEDDGNKSEVGSDKALVPATENVPLKLHTIVQSDVKVVTVSNVCVRLPNSPVNPGIGEQGPGSFDGLNVAARDLAWMVTFRPGSSTRRLQLGIATACLEKSCQKSTPTPLVEALGFELLIMESSADGGDKDELFVNLDKVRVDLCLSAVQDVMILTSAVTSPLGYPIAWKPESTMSKTSRTSFQAEACGTSFSRIVLNRPRLEMAQRQSLCAEVASVTVSLKRSSPGCETNRSILQSGVAPMKIRDSGVVAPFVKLDILQEKSPGVLNAVPIICSIKLFSLNPELLETSCARCQLVIHAQVAHMYMELQGIFQLVAEALNIGKRIAASLPVGKDLKPRSNDANQSAMMDTSVNSVPTNWGITINVRAGGGEVRMNEALQLSIPPVSLSSVQTETSHSSEPGGATKIEFSLEDTTLSASEDGVLKDLSDPMVLSAQGCCATVEVLQSFIDRRLAYAVDATLHVSSIQASLSRLKLLYLSKIPVTKSEPEPIYLEPTEVSQSIRPNERKVAENLASRCRWHLRVGAQFDLVRLSCTADVNKQASHRSMQTRAVVDGKLLNICVASRIANYHPIKSHIEASGLRSFTDIQASIGDVQIVERLQGTGQDTCTAFGDFLRLPEHAFLGILVCLDLPELKCLSESVNVASSSIPDQQSLPPAMLSWHLTSSIAKACQEASVKSRRSEVGPTQPITEIPLVAFGNDSSIAKNAHSFPVLSGFYRNYSEAGVPHHVIAGSVESVDVAVTTSSLYCLASVLNVAKSKTNSEQSNKSGDYSTSECESGAQDLPDDATPVSLTGIEVSLLLGQVRLILPSESLMDAIASRRSAVAGNVFFVVESLSVVSAVRNDISLDGLGYPPFNSRVLPKRPTVQAQRFGQSQLRIGCRAGKISGFVAELDFARSALNSTSTLEAISPFEDRIGRVVGCSARVCNVETFWSPFNATCSIEEEALAASEGSDAEAKASVSIALTKVRLDLHKPSFDILVTRVVGTVRGVGALCRSVVAPPHVVLKAVQVSRPQKPLTPRRIGHREVSFSCDGVEVNTFDTFASTHVRVGAIVLVHNLSDLSGNASIQNVVVGHRTVGGPRSPTLRTIATEEVVFGAHAEPSLWQLAVENYPEKLIAARWNFGDRTEGTLFLDVQAYQLHVSHHLIQALARFAHSEREFLFTGSYVRETTEQSVESVVRRPFKFQPRWNIKVLVAPSIMSYWRQTPTKSGRSGVWMSSGQVFASVGVGSGAMSQQSQLIHGQAVNEMNRFVAVPSLEMMLNVDKFGINTSDDLPPLEVHFQRSTVGPVPTHTASTWQRFSKYVSAVSEAQRLLHDCSVRITGDQQQMIERLAVGNDGVCLLVTPLVRTSIQAEVNALCIKLSSFSLGAIQSLLTARMDGGKQADSPSQEPSGNTWETNAEVSSDRSSLAIETFEGFSTDDFKSLRRMAEGRRPSPGELVLTEALLIETQSVASSSLSPVSSMKARVQVEPSSYNIGLADVAAFLENCNEPWGFEEQDERSSSITGLGNKTHSWMGMRWCYHIPRKLCKIVANPVPIPPTGVPSGWPSWSWDPDQEGEARRLCDILCQLRCWDSQKACFVVVCEFFVPWERASTNSNYDNSDDAYEPGSFGELMSQWFDDDLEETRYRAKLLEFGARTRTFSLDDQRPSDNWELRWRCPLQSEQETENKQKRLVVNALLASSLQVHSTLACGAYQRVISNVTLPQVMLSVSHVDSANDSHDIITAEINDTVLSGAVSGSSQTTTLSLRVSSAIQVYLDNMVQLLTVSVIPRTTVDAMIEASGKGLAISTLIGPVSVYLNQTSMLVLSSIPKLLRAGTKSSQRIAADEKLASMRIRISNYSGVDIWYQQEGTSECLVLAAGASSAYSWLSLANSPFYQLRFAVEDPLQKRVEIPVNVKDEIQGEQSAKADPRWCDPCRIKENAVTGRYFSGHGFLWICVELSGLQTIVTLRSSLTIHNYCDFPIRVKLNKKAEERCCARSDEFYQETRVVQRSARHHSSCISLDGSACTLGAPTEGDDNVSRIMVESVSNVDFGIDGGSWCSMAPHERIPSEFDLVKISDDQVDSFKKAQYSFATLHPENPDEPTQYAWAKIGRVQCKTILPTDFDPLQPQISRRYTWMEVSFWPAVTVENIMDTPVALSFSQKATTVNLQIAPSSKRCISAINPFEAVAVELNYGNCPGTEPRSLKQQKFVLECNTGKKEQSFDLDGCRLVATFTDESHPTIRIRTECVLSVANMTPTILNVKIGSPLGNQGALEKIESSVERSVGLSVVSNRLVISIAAIGDPTAEAEQVDWSPEVSLNVHGDTKPVVVPPARAGLRSLTCAYCIELTNSDGYLKLIIRPQVVVINSTNRDLKFLPTDGRGNALVEEDASLAIPGENAGWCVPVCLHKEAKKRSITADMSSWLSSKLSRRPSEDLASAPKQALVARLSCSFRVSLAEDGFEWTEEIAVLLPKLPLQLDPDGKLKITELPTSSTAPPKTQEGLYPAPSTTTHRRRLLIRHRGFQHKMLTYTMTQKGSSIHILFFVDHQPPVIIHNQWQNILGFRNVSFPSDPEGIGADFYLEYDWDLQVSAKQRESRRKLAEESSDTGGPNQDSRTFIDWLESSAQSLDHTEMPSAAVTERTRFQIGSPQYGWSNALWQVGGIQFASFPSADESGLSPTFLVMCFYRAGSWLISITCLEDPTRDGQAGSVPSLVLPSMASPTKAEHAPPAFLRVGVVVEELSLHFCDEHDPVRDSRGMILYPEILRATCNAVSIVFATAPDPPEVSRHSTRLGYLSHIRSYTTLFVAVEDIEVGHFLQTCNFPVILCFPETHASKDLLQFDRVKKYEKLSSLVGSLLGKRLPGAENSSLLARVIYTDTWDPVGIPSYFHGIELKLSPTVLQVEDDILSYLNAFIRPVLDALEGETAASLTEHGGSQSLADTWNALAYQSVMVTKQRKVFIEHLEISNVQVTVTARVSIPVLNSFDGTPLYFGATEMRDVFAFPDQLYKDLAADYVADTIVRSPMLLMSLNIIGNPAGFLRSFGQGVRDLVEIPLAASRNGYSPWVLTKGVLGGVASFVGHATAATLTSVSGFSYSISRTMDQLTLPPEQLRKRHYPRPTQLSSALTGGLGSLGSSVVGAATGVITTPIAIYRQRQMQGLDTGIRNVVGGVGMGLVGIVARPMGGVASLVSMASDGLLYGMGGNRTPFDDSVSQFDARPNELLRYKLKVLPDATGSKLIFAHGIWIVPEESKLITGGHDLDCISQEELGASENEPIRSLLRPTDTTQHLVRVTVVCSSECIYVVGVSGAQNQTVLARTSLESVEAVEESLSEPTIFDLGIKTPGSAEWLRFRLPPRQRRNLSHQLRLWLAENVV